jgi:hypothetical protein
LSRLAGTLSFAATTAAALIAAPVGTTGMTEPKNATPNREANAPHPTPVVTRPASPRG